MIYRTGKQSKGGVYLAQEYAYGTGRRKCSVARVRLIPGKGNIIINNKSLEEYFEEKFLRFGQAAIGDY